MKKLYFFSLFIFFSNLALSQIYKPIDTADYAKRQEFLKNYKERSKSFNKTLREDYSKDQAKALEKIFISFQKEIEQNVKDKEYLFNDEFSSFINQKLDLLKSKNPELPSNIYVLISKSNSPNAYSVGDGIIVVNMGLFRFMDNDDEFTGVLGHEIAHESSKHMIKSALAKYESNKNSKKEVKELKKSTDNRYDKAFNLFQEMLYSNVKLKRKNEIQADSLSFVYLKNAGLDERAVARGLKILQEYDNDSISVVSPHTYKEVFNFPNQSFKDEWMKMEDFSKYNYDFYKPKLSKDSLQTHPDLDIRINLLSKDGSELNQDTLSVKPSVEYGKLSELARNEVLPNQYQTKKYGVGIYNCLIKLQDNPNDEFAKEYLGKFFTKVYEARKTYTLNRYLDRVDPKEQEQTYQQFLSFMWNLNLDEIKNIAEYYDKSGT